MSVSFHPERRADVRTEVLPDGSGLLYDPSARLAYALSSSAVAVWDACDGTRSPAAIADQLEAVYDAAPARIRTDVEHLLNDFKTRGLLVQTDGHAG